MCLAKKGFSCAECGCLFWDETSAITCFIQHVVHFQGDIERIPNDNKRILQETIYHLTQALDHEATDFEDASSKQLLTLRYLLAQLIVALNNHEAQQCTP